MSEALRPEEAWASEDLDLHGKHGHKKGHKHASAGEHHHGDKGSKGVTFKGAMLNVLFIVVDDLRLQMGFQGPGVLGPGCGVNFGNENGCRHMHTPNMDALASQSVVFDHMFVPGQTV